MRRGRTVDALASLSHAVELAPSSARYAYVYGVALNSAGAGDRALSVLRDGHEHHPGDPDILVALATISRDRGDRGSGVGPQSDSLWSNSEARALSRIDKTFDGRRRGLRPVEAPSVARRLILRAARTAGGWPTNHLGAVRRLHHPLTSGATSDTAF